MTLQEAIVARHSVRQYQEKPIEAGIIKRLNDEIALCNQEGGLHIQLVLNEPKAFTGGMVKYGRFVGVRNYMAMVGPKGADEAIGYYGEKLVLFAQSLGLNTCWTGGFNHKTISAEVAPDEKLVIAIAIGYGKDQGKVRKSKTFEQVVEAAGERPDWFNQGVEMALLAPTAINQQKFVIKLADGEKVEFIDKGGPFSKVDIGIVKCHFEIGSGKIIANIVPNTYNC